MSPPRYSRGMGLLVVCLFVATACGSTVGESSRSGVPGSSPADLDSRGAAEIASDEEFSLAGNDDAPGDDAGTVNGRPGLPSAQDPASTSGARAGSAGPRSAPAESPAAPAASAEESIAIGYQYVGGVEEGTSAIFGAEFQTGDMRAQGRILAEYINAGNGLGGRRLELVEHNTNYAQFVANPEAEAERMCARFAQDQPVFAALIMTPTEHLISCLGDRRVVTVSDYYVLDRGYFERFPEHYYAPGTMSLDRGAEVMVDELGERRFFDGATIGIVYQETPGYARAKDSLVEALRRHGLAAAEEFGVSTAGGTSGTVSQTNNAVLRMRSAGVDLVLFVDWGGLIAAFFMNGAESQGYRPRYGLNGNNNLQAITQVAPAQQLVNATAVGFMIYDDLQDDSHNPTRDRCLDIFQRGGADVTSDNNITYLAMMVCDHFLFLDRAFEDVGAAPVTSRSLATAVAGLGPQYTAPNTYATVLEPGRNDGAAAIRMLRYEPDCTCFVNSGPVIPTG